MNILYIVPYVPSQVRVRPFNFIKQLTAHGHHVTVLTLWTSQQELGEVEGLRPYCESAQAYHLPLARSLWNCLGSMPTSKPLQAAYCWQPKMAKELFNLLTPEDPRSGFDIVHVEHLRGAGYGLYLRANRFINMQCPPIVWDSVDSIGLLDKQAAVLSKSRARRWLSGFEVRRTAAYERWLVNQFDRVIVTSKKDKSALTTVPAPGYESPSITVVPNGVDLEYYRPDLNISREPATLVISGKMSYHANVAMVLHFAQEIMPLICAQRPDVKLVVVGKDPPPKIRALSHNPAITVTGTVKEIRPYLQRASIAVVPILYGVGIQNKILEAMACATPVIATPQAISSLEVCPGEDVLVAQAPAHFAEAVFMLLDDTQRRRQIGLAGRRYVETHHDWGDIVDDLEEIYKEMTGEKSRKLVQYG